MASATKTTAQAAGKKREFESLPELQARLATEVSRAIERNLKGLQYLGARAPAVGQTPKTVLYRQGTLSLYHYTAQTEDVYRVPLLLVMAPTNRAFIFDLAPGQSLVEFLVQKGYDVYVMDWSPPTRDEAHLKLEDYALGFIPDCIRRVQEDSGEEDITLVGYCAGGMLSTIYMAQNPDGPVRNFACFTTPIDFRHMELWRNLADEKHFDVDKLVDRLGIIPPDVVVNSFDMLRPAGVVAGRIRLWDNLWNDQYVEAFRRMDRWGAETLPLPGGYFAQTVKELLRKNALYEGSLRVGGRPVDMGKIKVPLLHIMAEYDHIVPVPSSRPLFERVGSADKEEVVLPGGHVSLVAGPNAVKRMWPKLNEWLERRST